MQKKNLVMILGFIIVVALLFIIFLVSPKTSSDNKYTVFTDKLKSKIIPYTKNQLLPENIVLILNQLNDPKVSDEKKYEMLKTLEFYFATQYSVSHDPSLREFVKDVIGGFAKNNLTKYYKEVDFIETCADPKCGQEIDEELEQAIELINSDSNIRTEYKNTFIKNLKTAAYMPDTNIEGKQFGLGLVASDLESVGYKSASDTANLIKVYFKNKYNKDLFIERI